MSRIGLRSERGVAMVEFGLILPLIFSLSVGVIDVGRAFYQYNTIAHASREASRFAAVWGGSQHPEFPWGTPYNGDYPATYSNSSGHPVAPFAGTTTIVGTVVRLAPGFDLNNMSVRIAADQGASWGEPISVTVSYAFQPATTLLLGSSPLTLTATSQMIIE